MAEGQGPEPPRGLSEDAVAIIDGMDEDGLRAVIEYAQERRRRVHTEITESIEAAPGEEIVRIEERPSYTEVIKKEPCGEDCAECPHGPYLYHVREGKQQNGGAGLHWTYLGPVIE